MIDRTAQLNFKHLRDVKSSLPNKLDKAVDFIRLETHWGRVVRIPTNAVRVVRLGSGPKCGSEDDSLPPTGWV